MQQLISAGEFKTHCLSLMDQVQKSGAELVITKRGKPVAKLVPAGSKHMPLAGFMKKYGEVKIHGDIMQPIKVKWKAQG